MALRTFQFCIVFAIGVWTRPAAVVVAGGARSAGGEIGLSLKLENPPQDVIVSRTQAVTLRCMANSSEGPVRISWLYDNEPILPNDTRRLIQHDGSLYIRKVAGKRASVEGNYTCLATNRIGSLLSNPAKLKVAILPKEFQKQPEDISVTMFQPVYLPCQIQSTPNAFIEWERNGNALPQNATYVPLPTGELLIDKAQKSDAGSYRCKVYNKLLKKQRFSNEGVLTVVPQSSEPQAPKLLELSDLNPIAQVGSDIQLFCVASGWPKPTIRWTYNSTLQLGNSSVLKLKNLTEVHNGLYSCRASNVAGQVTQVYKLVVFQSPYFIKLPASQWFPPARYVRLDCVAGGIPKPQIYWFKNGNPLELEDRFERRPTYLLFTHSFIGDSGLYQCVAENQHGRIWSAVQLIANASSDPPSTPKNLRCSSYNTSSICLEWDTPPKDVVFEAYTIHVFNASGDSETFVTNKTFAPVYNLKPNMNYTFYIRIYSNRAASERSNNVTCQTVLIGHREIELNAISSTSLQVNWTKLSSDEPCGGTAEYKVQWRRHGYPSNNAVRVFENHFIITELQDSEKYQVRVQSSNNEDDELAWSEYIMPPNNNNNEPKMIGANEENENDNDASVLAPIKLEAEPKSWYSMNVSWVDPRQLSDRTLGGYYMVCYTDVKSQQTCERNDNHVKFIKSTTTSIEIHGLNPYTSYEFRVRSHNLDGTFSQFSYYSVESRTLENVPDPVSNLDWQSNSPSSHCIRWQAPNRINGKLKHYLISYTSSNQSLDKWTSMILPLKSIPSQSCWIPNHNQATVSIQLPPLDPNHNYRVIVRAATKVGLSLPSNLIQIGSGSSQPAVTDHSAETETERPFVTKPDQKLGIVIGTSIAFMCVLGCITCMVFRRRCLKRQALQRYAPRPTNGQTTVIQNTPTNTVDTALESHELHCLVTDDATQTNILLPVVGSQAHIDTKGGVRYPNGGQMNGITNGHLPNGTVRITENPQFESFDCNGHYEHSDSHQLLHTDQNLNDSLVDEEASFNTTQMTNLDESVTRSPILGPNG